MNRPVSPIRPSPIADKTTTAPRRWAFCEPMNREASLRPGCGAHFYLFTLDANRGGGHGKIDVDGLSYDQMAGLGHQ
jgi:hypothetical protein